MILRTRVEAKYQVNLWVLEAAIWIIEQTLLEYFSIVPRPRNVSIYVPVRFSHTRPRETSDAQMAPNTNAGTVA